MSNAPDPFDFLKAFWNPLGLPFAGMGTPTLNVPEIEKRIADLKLVENWLNMNLSMLRMSIQGLEMQRLSLAAMQDAGQMPDSSVANAALDAWLKMMQPGGMAPPPPSEPPKSK